jgi:hypothetical protein
MFAKQTSRGRASAGAVVHVLLGDTAACLWPAVVGAVVGALVAAAVASATPVVVPCPSPAAPGLPLRSDPARRLHDFAIDDLTFNANADLVPRTADDCREDARTKFHVDGVTFKNQGDCVSFVETLGKNPPTEG